MGALENDLNPDVSIGLSLPLGHSDSGFFEQTQTTLKQTSTNIKKNVTVFRTYFRLALNN